MAIRNSHSTPAATDTSSPLTWSHVVGVGTPKGVLVFVVTESASDTVTGVTYGSLTLERLRWSASVGEAGSVYAYFMGVGVPTGDQTVTVTFTGSAEHVGCCVVFNASDGVSDTFVMDHQTVISASLADPEVTITVTGGLTTHCMAALFSGQGAVNGIAPDGSSFGIAEFDFGQATCGFERHTGAVASTTTIGFQQSADDAVLIGVGVADLGGASSSYISSTGWF